jgi:hypothetical protein
MQELKLTLEQAIEYYNSSSDKGFKDLLEQHFGKDFYKPKAIYDEVYDVSSLIARLGYNPILFVCPKNLEEKYLNACSILAEVAKIYNQGKPTTWDGSTYHYIPSKYFSTISGVSVCFNAWSACLYCSGRLYYTSEVLAKKSYNNFKNYWEDFWSV